MFVQFKTNATIDGPGFDASFITNTSTSPCSGLTNLTAASGSINDGSGTANYQNNANCSWLIQPAGSPASITLNMNSINLADIQDMVRVYDGTSNTAPVVGNFFLNNAGSPAIAYSGSMFVEFTSKCCKYCSRNGMQATLVLAPSAHLTRLLPQPQEHLRMALNLHQTILTIQIAAG